MAKGKEEPGQTTAGKNLEKLKALQATIDKIECV